MLYSTRNRFAINSLVKPCLARRMISRSRRLRFPSAGVFAFRKLLKMLKNHTGQRGRGPTAALMHSFDGFDQFGRDGGFEYACQYAGFERVKQLLGLMEMRQGNHPKLGQFLAQTANTFQSAHARKAQTDDDHLRSGGGQQPQGVLRAGKGADTAQAWCSRKNGLQRFAQRPVAFDQADSNFR